MLNLLQRCVHLSVVVRIFNEVIQEREGGQVELFEPKWTELVQGLTRVLEDAIGGQRFNVPTNENVDNVLWQRFKASIVSILTPERTYHEETSEHMRIDAGKIDDGVRDHDHQRCVNDGLENFLQFFTDVLNVIGEAEHFMFVLKAASEGADEQLSLGVVSSHVVQSLEDPFGESDEQQRRSTDGDVREPTFT